MSKNFGMTQQDLPNFRLPEVLGVKGSVGKPSLMGMQTDVLGLDSLYGAAIDKRHLEVDQGAGILKKTLTAALLEQHLHYPLRYHTFSVYIS